MSGFSERDIRINGSAVAIREKGKGKPLALMMGFGGSPYWPEFAEILSQTRHVHLISLPGQHGSERGHEFLHTSLDWVVMALETLELGVGEREPVDLVACSAAGILGIEIAALAPQKLRSLTLIGPLGLYDPDNPPHNPYAEAPFDRPKMLMVDQARYKKAFGPPPGLDEMEVRSFDVTNYRSDEAMARLIWPFGDIKGYRRLHRIKSTPLLLLWGEKDQVVPPAYAQRFDQLIPAPTKIRTIADAGHLATFDKPEETSEIVLSFLPELDR